MYSTCKKKPSHITGITTLNAHVVTMLTVNVYIHASCNMTCMHVLSLLYQCHTYCHISETRVTTSCYKSCTAMETLKDGTFLDQLILM